MCLRGCPNCGEGANILVEIVLHGESYKRMAPPRNTTKQRKPTINPNDRQSETLTDQAPGTTERAALESSRITSTSTATLHASSTAIPINHHTDPAGSSPQSLQPTQPSARRRQEEPQDNTDTTRTSGDTQTPPPVGPTIRRNWWTAGGARPASWGGGGEEGREG